MSLNCWADVAHTVGLWAQSTDPLAFRGGGYYYSIAKIVIVLIVYGCWISTCTWVHRDSKEVGLDARLWNSALFGAGLLGLLCVWGLSSFFPGLLLLLLLYGGALAGYVFVRNMKVPAAERVFTERHLRAVVKRFFRPEKKPKKEKTPVKSRKRREEPEEESAPAEEPTGPVQFLSAGQQGGDPKRLARVQASKGYRLVVQLLQQLVRRGATDIRLDPAEEEVAVRFRVNGALQAGDVFPRPVGEAVLNTFKMLAALEVSEKRKPQEGTFAAEIEGRPLDFRVASAGTTAGEKLAVRIVDRSRPTVTLGQIGLSAAMYQQVRGIITGPPGLFVVCGPAESGTTATLYAALSEIDRSRHPIVTLEKPIASPLEGITQIEINPEEGRAFAAELRNILAQPADMIMLSDLPDRETVEVAGIAAQAGRRVYAGLQANDALEAVRRLVELKVNPALVATALSGVLAQRLLRVLCPECRVGYKPDADLVRKLNLPAQKGRTLYHPPDPSEAEESGAEPCARCGGSGYLGRTGVFELLVVTEEVRKAIRDNPDLSTLKEEASKAGLRPLREDGLRHVLEGRTSVAEMLKVCK
jgi:type II secretory ATPase GspE/PulE/Tfp pilus assembly ATPase PilB-like protein